MNWKKKVSYVIIWPKLYFLLQTEEMQADEEPEDLIYKKVNDTSENVNTMRIGGIH